jgi:hypothetical protein
MLMKEVLIQMKMVNHQLLIMKKTMITQGEIQHLVINLDEDEIIQQ